MIEGLVWVNITIHILGCDQFGVTWRVALRTLSANHMQDSLKRGASPWARIDRAGGGLTAPISYRAHKEERHMSISI
jgi:hypothetical protein